MTKNFSNQKQRAEDGYIATLVNRETGELEASYRPGFFFEETYYTRNPDGSLKRGRIHHMMTATDLLHELCRELEARPGDWRIRTLSNPTTILADLRGRPQDCGRAAPPELGMLRRVGLARFHEDYELQQRANRENA